jgi:hypothetical protein
MEMILLNTSFEAVDIVDSFKSNIWTDRYQDCGDLELYVPATTENIQKFQKGYYLISEESEHVMIIEDFDLTNDEDDGEMYKIVGRSSESIMERRIIWSQTILSGNFQNAVKKLLDENLISPSLSQRKIDNFIFEESDDENITKLTIEAQYTGDNLFDSIKAMCQNVDVGFKVTLNESNQFVFRLYIGTDRSYDQSQNPFVIFSPAFENVLSSEYIETNSTYKNVALVAGEGEGSDRTTTTSGDDTASGLDRYELYVDARDLSTKTSSGTLTSSEYLNQLVQRGNEKLADCKDTKAFDGEMEVTKMYSYGSDFFIGDICQFESNNGIAAKVRITEYIRSEDDSGISAYPTFEIINEDE